MNSKKPSKATEMYDKPFVVERSRHLTSAERDQGVPDTQYSALVVLGESFRFGTKQHVVN